MDGLTIRYRARAIRTIFLVLFASFLGLPTLVVMIAEIKAGHASASLGPGSGLFAAVGAALLAERRTLRFDRTLGILTMSHWRDRQTFTLQGLQRVDVEKEGSRARLVLVYGASRLPLTATLYYGLAHHEAVARAANTFLGAAHPIARDRPGASVTVTQAAPVAPFADEVRDVVMTASGFTVEGTSLVIVPDVVLPPVCLKCGAATEGHVRSHVFEHTLTKTRLPICKACDRVYARLRMRLLALFTGLGVLVTFGVYAARGHEKVLWVVALGGAISIFQGFEWARKKWVDPAFVQADHASEGRVWVKGVHPRVLSRLSAGPMGPAVR